MKVLIGREAPKILLLKIIFIRYNLGELYLVELKTS